MVYIQCRHCNSRIGSAGFKGHLRAVHSLTNYDAEIKAHGLKRENGRLVPTGDSNALVADPKPTPPVKRQYQRRQPIGPRTMTITEEAMAIALTGLERIQADLSRHVEDVRAQLNGPVRKAKSLINRISLGPSRAEEILHNKDDISPPKLLWAGGRHWSNDPDCIYSHHTDGTLKLDASGRPRLKGGRWQGKPRPTANALRLRKYRAAKRNAIATEGATQ